MTTLELLDQSTVTADQIDALGHMNVRYYLSRMAEANDKLMQLKLAGLGPDTLIRRTDTYTKFINEQFTGATLATWGGLVADHPAAKAGELAAYLEIRNSDSGKVAASFLVVNTGIGRGNGKELPLAEPAEVMKWDDLPGFGLPRSLSLDAPRQVTLADIEAKIPHEATPGMMSGRRESAVHPDDCEANGRLREDVDLMFVLHRPGSDDGDPSKFGPPTLTDSKGRRYSFAMMETRSCVWQRPMKVDVVVSLGADLAFGEKWRHSRRWMFVRETGALLGISDTVGICLDLDARRAIPMPEEVRVMLEKNCLPEFA